ncbi:hypothetical protein F53441_13035 [Fusarium austroafricanum]|uniref:Myb-like domain-containing protein n=1 Tax=Fusarium austroafricanum TaxID=2364996 RepID=A0A8H4NMH7_9HYPO|nr:hypothetical protein F53441_13035 [Fusarium austroafricanum]
MSDATPKANAWTDEAKNELLLRIIAQLKPEGKGINWSEIHMEGRTVKSLQNQWTAFNKKMEAYKQQSADGGAVTTPAKKTPGRKRGPKAKKIESEDEEIFESPRVTPRKRRAPTETPEAKAVKKELSDAIIKDELKDADSEDTHGEA